MHAFQPQELQQLYQVELILRLEAPDLGLDTSHIDRYEALFAGKCDSCVGALSARIGPLYRELTGLQVSDFVGCTCWMNGRIHGCKDPMLLPVVLSDHLSVCLVESGDVWCLTTCVCVCMQPCRYGGETTGAVQACLSVCPFVCLSCGIRRCTASDHMCVCSPTGTGVR